METPREETLDPSDWAPLKALGHKMVDDMVDLLQNIRERPVWQPVGPASRAEFQTAAPEQPQPLDNVYLDFQTHVAPYPLGNIHPRFWGWVIGSGTPVGMLAELLAAGLNPNVHGGEQSATWVERQVIGWLKEMLGFPAEASGILVSGASMANLVALAVARTAKAEANVREQGVAAGRRMVLYASSETHSSVQRAVEILGLGNRWLRQVPVDAEFRMDTGALRRSILHDREQGRLPIALVANAGTVNTGAIDPLDELADVAQEFGLWLHVDGAFGALAYLAPKLRSLVRGMERADSLAFDLHKWLHMPYDVGCVLIRQEGQHLRTFGLRPAYLQEETRGPSAGPMWYGDYGPQLSRSFRALKVWMTLKAYGVGIFRRLVQQNVDQAAYLSSLIEAHPQLALAAPTPLNVVCFRYLDPGRSPSELDALNRHLLLQLQESGGAVPTGTSLHCRFALRCAITNHRSRRADFDELVEQVVDLGDHLVKEG